jgi:hypothetical protein
MNLREAIWPILEPLTDVEQGQDAERLKQDIATIEASQALDEQDALLEEARRLFDADDDRRKTAETKATTYLAVIGVLAPILASITPTLFSPKSGVVRPILALVIFIAAGAYLFCSGLWALRALAVSASTRVDARPLTEIWDGDAPKRELAKTLLACVRRNRDGINLKVTNIKMAHAFAIRAFGAFLLAIILRSAWDPIASLMKIVLGH